MRLIHKHSFGQGIRGIELGLRKKVSNIHRLCFILSILLKTGVEIFVERICIKCLESGRSRSDARSERELRGYDEAAGLKKGLFLHGRLRQVLERLGPTFMKLGQVLSLRPDLIGEDLAKELSKLQDRASPFSFEQARQIIEEDLGRSPEELFGGLDTQPFAAASLAQVHRAWLMDGTEVAVKVQRPGIRKVVEQDLQILLRLADRAEQYIACMRPYHPVLVVKEFADWTLRELDFSVEGHNADRFRFSFRENPHVKVPRIYWEYTAPRILTMELVQGAKVDDLAAIEALGGDEREVMLRILEAFVQQFLSDGFFHADPHPGNLFVLENSLICFTDFGMVGYLNESIRRDLLSCFAAYVNGHMEGFLKHFTHLAELHNDSDMAGFQKDAAEILNELFFSQNPLSMAHLFFRLINKGAGRRITFPTGLALFAKAIMTTESIGRGLYPEFDFNVELPPFIQRAADDYLDIARISRSLQTDMYDYMDFFKNFPDQAKKVLARIGEDGQITVKIDAAQLLDIRKEMDRRTDTRILGTLMVTVIAGTLFLFWFDHTGTVSKPLSVAGITLVIILLFWFLIKRWRRH
ncbi:MAG: AarF/UbiB family protein [Syntrophorhabdus sp.]